MAALQAVLCMFGHTMRLQSTCRLQHLSAVNAYKVYRRMLRDHVRAQLRSPHHLLATDFADQRSRC